MEHSAIKKNYLYNHMDKIQTHYAEWKKLEAKGNVLYDSIYMTFWKRQNHRDSKEISGYQMG